MHGRDVAFGARRSWVLGIALVSGPGLLVAQTGPGPFARMVLLRAREGMSAQFEAGYQRHLEWHRSNRDPWSWYGWSVVFGERVDWFMDGTFGHSAGSLDSAVAPAADGRDADTNVASYADFMSNGIYEFLPDVSNGSPEHRRLRCWSSRLTTSSRAPVRRSSKGSGHGRVMVRRVTGFGSSRAGRYRVTCASDRDRISPSSRRAPRWKPYHQPVWPASCASQWRCCDSDRT